MSYYVIIRGPLGCGKSTIAHRLAKILNAEYVSIDKVLEEHGLDKVEPAAGCIPAENFIKANELVLPKVKEKIKSGKIVIFDACFYHKEAIEHLIRNLKYCAPNKEFFGMKLLQAELSEFCRTAEASLLLVAHKLSSLIFVPKNISGRQYPHYIFTLKAPIEICIERDRKRGKTHGEDAARAVHKLAAKFDYGTVIDMSKPLDEAIEEILSHLPKH